MFGGKQAGCIFVARRSTHALILLSSSLSRSSAICHCDLKKSRAAPSSFLKLPIFPDNLYTVTLTRLDFQSVFVVHVSGNSIRRKGRAGRR